MTKNIIAEASRRGSIILDSQSRLVPVYYLLENCGPKIEKIKYITQELLRALNILLCDDKKQAHLTRIYKLSIRECTYIHLPEKKFASSL